MTIDSHASRTPMPPAMNGFEFKQRREAINWRLLSSVDVDKIIRQMDIGSLQGILENIAFCDIQSETFDGLDKTFFKLFQLSQLIIEYLLHSQDYILENRNQLRDQTKDLQKQIAALTLALKEKDGKFDEMKKESKATKKTLYAYQLMAKIPGGIGEQGHAATASYYRCEFCPKTFSSSFYLDSHLYRRHGDKSPVRPTMPAQPQQSAAQNNQMGIQANFDIQKITETVEQFAGRIIETERIFRKELEEKMEQKLLVEVQHRQNLIEEAYKQERLRYHEEIQHLKSSLHKELQEERQAFRQQKEAIELFMRNNRNGITHVGKMEDDDEETKSKFQDASVLSDFESKQSNILSGLKSKMQNDLEITMAKMAADHATDAKIMEARLQAAVNELHDAQDALNLEKRNRSPSLTPQLRVDTSPVRHVSFKGASPPAKVVISQETIIQKPVQVPTSLLDTWNELLQKLSGHLQVSNPQAPWARSLLSHNPSDPETLQMRHSILEHLQKALSNLGLNEEQILANWERDPQIKEQLLSLLEKQLVQIEEHAKEDPIFGKTRQLMAQDLDQAVRLYYVPPLLSLSLDNKIQTDAFETAKAEIAYHRRAQSENVTGAKGLPPLPSLSGPRTHWRANTALSFSALQSQILKFVRKRQGSENSELSASPMSTESPKSVLAPASPVRKPKKKSFGLKNAFKNLLNKATTRSGASQLPAPPTKDDINTSAVITETSYLAEGTDQEQSSVLSRQSSDVDYSNPARKIVYQSAPGKAAVEETDSAQLDIISEIAETETQGSNDAAPAAVSMEKTVASEPENVDEETESIAQQQEVTKPKQESNNFSDTDEFTNTSVSALQSKSKTLEVSHSKDSEDSFDVSELSEVTDTATKEKRVDSTQVNEGQVDRNILLAKTGLEPKSNDRPKSAGAKKKDISLSDILDNFSDDEDSVSLRKPINASTASATPAPKDAKRHYDDDFDLDDF